MNRLLTLLAMFMLLLVVSPQSACGEPLPAAEPGDVDKLVASIETDEQYLAAGALSSIERRAWTDEELSKLMRAMTKRYSDGDSRSNIAYAIVGLARRHPGRFRDGIDMVVRSIEPAEILASRMRWSQSISIIHSIGTLGDDGKVALPTLRKLVAKPDRHELRFLDKYAAAAILKLGPADPKQADAKLVDLLVAGLEGDEEWFCLSALTTAGFAAAKAAEPVAKRLTAENEVTRLLAASAIVRLEKESRPAAIDIFCTALEREPIEYPMVPGGPSMFAGTTDSLAARSLAGLQERGRPAVTRLNQLEARGTDRQKRFAKQAREAIEMSAAK